MSTKRLNINSYIAQRQSNLGSGIIGEKGVGKVIAYYSNFQLAKKYESNDET